MEFMQQLNLKLIYLSLNLQTKKKYHAAQETRDMFRQASVELVVVEDEVEKYPGQ